MIIYNRKQWKEFAKNTKNYPRRYPVYAYNQWENFGIMGDALVSHYKIIPKKYVTQIDLINAYCKGFEDAIDI